MRIDIDQRPVRQYSRRAVARAPLTLGVEEEFLLLDPVTAAPMPVVGDAVRVLPAGVREHSRLEFHSSQMEMVSPVCTDLQVLRDRLAYHRRVANAAAESLGARLVAVGTGPVPADHAHVTDVPRYAEMADRFGALARDPGVCGCHVHVGVPDRETAVQVCNHLRPWLPVIQAMCVNSPFESGVDSGFASWRHAVFGRWPSVGPTPYLRSAHHYDELVAQLVAAGIMMDEAMVYWYARPSARYPTVEVRVGDVCPTADDAALVAALVRGLVDTAIGQVAAGFAAPEPPEQLVAAAHWQAARDGLVGELIDLRAGRLRPAWRMIADLVDAVRPALLRHGDLPMVMQRLRVLRARGTGAERQRAVFGRTGDITAVVAELATLTVAGDG
jgi:glutamate---cysteine ligase / carboxylate-amine ligase